MVTPEIVVDAAVGYDPRALAETVDVGAGDRGAGSLVVIVAMIPSTAGVRERWCRPVVMDNPWLTCAEQRNDDLAEKFRLTGLVPKGGWPVVREVSGRRGGRHYTHGEHQGRGKCDG